MARGLTTVKEVLMLLLLLKSEQFIDYATLLLHDLGNLIVSNICKDVMYLCYKTLLKNFIY